MEGCRLDGDVGGDRLFAVCVFDLFDGDTEPADLSGERWTGVAVWRRGGAVRRAAGRERIALAIGGGAAAQLRNAVGP